jgi:hypothetical protein
LVVTDGSPIQIQFPPLFVQLENGIGA